MTTPGIRPLIAALALAPLVLALGLLSHASAGGGGGGGGGGDNPAKQLGKTPRTPKPSCPAPNVEIVPEDESCQVFGRVTGIQLTADGRRGILKMPENGRIVAWSVDLARPDRQEREDLGQLLGSERLGQDPTARIAVLKKDGDKRYTLNKQSPVVDLRSYYGERPVFTLSEPINARKGRFVGLSSPTWVPNFTHSGISGADNLWVASREEGRCTSSEDLTENSKPQQKEGSTRTYGCKYRGARILYWAFYVPRG